LPAAPDGALFVDRSGGSAFGSIVIELSGVSDPAAIKSLDDGTAWYYSTESGLWTVTWDPERKDWVDPW
jgi:hypothetical protein